MARPRQTDQDRPFYVRWLPDRCPYALEMRLDLVTRLKSELDQAERTRTEIGGVFFGALPTQDSPTLRLDDLIIVPGSAVAGAGVSGEFILDAGQVQHLTQMSVEASAAGRPFTGFFRSHLRSSLMVPTPADVSMLSSQFPEGLFAFLLIGPRLNSAREAAFFLAMSGHLPVVPSSPPFALDEGNFRSLREVPAEATEDVRNFQFTHPKQSRSLPWPAALSLALLLFMIGTWTLGSRISQFFRPPSNEIDLSVIKVGNNLKITWDHSSPVLQSALGATMVIMDGSNHRELKLNSDDLKLGQVSYERLTKKVYVVMSLEAPGSKLPAQTFDWNSD